MKVSITSHSGLIQQSSGNGVAIEGKEYHEAPFDNRWDDLIAVIDEGTGPAQLTYEAFRDTGFFMRFFRHNQDDNIFMTYQLPHQWNSATAVNIHAHIVPMASGSGNAKFDFAYSWINVGSEFPAASGWISGSVTASFTPAHQYKQSIVSFGNFTPVDQRESSILILKVERPGSSDILDTYTTNKDHGTGAANIGILSFDMHYQKSKAGTVSPYPEV